jgi:hypothetical protein
MEETHPTLSITEGEWAVFCADLQATFEKFGVPAAERAELFAIVESTKGDIVTGAAPAASSAA